MTSRFSLYLAALTISLSGCCHIFGDGESDESDAYDDCAEKDEGDECSLCAPDDEDCIETMEIKVCSADGECSSAGDICALPEGCAQHDHHDH